MIAIKSKKEWIWKIVIIFYRQNWLIVAATYDESSKFVLHYTFIALFVTLLQIVHRKELYFQY